MKKAIAFRSKKPNTGNLIDGPSDAMKQD